MAPASKARRREALSLRAGAFAAALGGLSALASCQLVGDFDEPRSTPEGPALRLAARASYACAWVVGGEAQCWGRRPSGAGARASAHVPASVREREGDALTGVAELALGDEHSCARLTDGRVKCWGSNAFGQLGVPPSGANDHSPVPLFVEDQTGAWLTGVVTIALGSNHSCALLADGHGRVVCWGSNARGQAGAAVEKGGQTYAPVVVEATGHADLTDVAQLSLGDEHSCARLTDGHVKCWGSNASGQLGPQIEGDDDASPSVVEGLEGVEEISVGGNKSCARLAGGRVKCWGEGYGPYPTPVGDRYDGDDGGLLSDAVELDSGGSSHDCVRDLEKVVKCWQRRPPPVSDAAPADGASAPALRLALLERDRFDDAPEPVKDQNGAPLRDVAELALGDDHSCARLTDGHVKCWGSNASGQLGNPTRAGDPEPISYPLPVEGLTLVR
ncbi:MAG TPA: hypothetical protein VFS43_16595 [Polyangiaceae bacterium]|nr:hypothetical protein [Polyangiaceae bacterium]